VSGSAASLTELEQAAQEPRGSEEVETSGHAEAVDPVDSGAVDDGASGDEGAAGDGGYDLLDEGEVPKLLARFKVRDRECEAALWDLSGMNRHIKRFVVEVVVKVRCWCPRQGLPLRSLKLSALVHPCR
jgi:hypothetical protein